MPKLIADRGPATARIVVIGEAPGKREWEEGAPFVGPSGWLLDQWMRDAGVDRSSVYYTNSCRYWPGEFAPAHLKVGLNDFKWLPKEIVASERQQLSRRLAALQDPIVLVPTGNRALGALGIAGRISDYRGSILSVGLDGPNGTQREVKTIPTIHPAATFRRPVLSRFCIADWQRIAADYSFRDLRLPTRNTIIASPESFNTFMAGLALQGGPVALDIECSIKDGSLQCIAAAYDPTFGIVIPLDIPGHKPDSDPFLRQCWEWAKALCGAIPTLLDSKSGPYQPHVGKVLQNGLFDQFILKRRGAIDLIDYDYDTLELSHMINANDGSDPQASEDGGDDIKIPMHSLSVLASLYTREPFYKGDARDGFKFGWSRLEDLWSYCARDAMVTIEVFGVLKKLAEERGLF